MEVVKKMNWDELVHEYQLDGKRILPWDGYPMPFGGAWCVVRPGTESLKHQHDEQEMFIIVDGEAYVHVGDNRHLLSKGDFIAIPRNQDHYVENVSDEDFHFFTVWWDQASGSDYLKIMEG